MLSLTSYFFLQSDKNLKLQSIKIYIFNNKYYYQHNSKWIIKKINPPLNYIKLQVTYKQSNSYVGGKSNFSLGWGSEEPTEAAVKKPVAPSPFATDEEKKD